MDPYPEPYESSSYSRVPIPLRYIPPAYVYVFSVVFFSSGIPI
jgi:hypothetical protein